MTVGRVSGISVGTIRFITVLCLSSACAPPQPDVLLISIDSLRSDHLGAYGYPRPTGAGTSKVNESGLKGTEPVANHQ